MNNMVYEDALTILSYASPYKVTLNLERDNRTNQKSSKKTKSNLRMQRSLGNSYATTTMLHPLYRTRSVDNLIQIGKYDNYGTAQNYRNNNQVDESDTRNGGYGRMINRFKQQIITYLNPRSISNGSPEQHANELAEKRSRRPLASIQNIFKANKWSDECSGRDDLNAVVVGNLAVGNLAFKDDDEDEEFRKQFQLSQLKYQQQQQQSQHYHNTYNVKNDLQASVQHSHSLEHENLTYQRTGVHYSRNTSYSSQQQASQPTNLIKYHQQTIADLSQVDRMQQTNQFVNINLNDLSKHQRTRCDDSEYNQSRKGNSTTTTTTYSTQPNELNDNSLTPSSQSFNSVPLTDEPACKEPIEQNRQSNANSTTIAEIHAIQADRFDDDRNKESKRSDDSRSKNVTNTTNKARSSSMNDLPNDSTTVSMNTAIMNHIMTADQSALERAISLDLSNQNAILSSSSKANLTNGLSAEDSKTNRRPTKIKIQSLKPSSFGDMLNNEKLCQQSLTNSLQTTSLSASLSNGKLSNQSKSIRNSSLSTNSTCSSPSLPSASSDTKMEYDDSSILMLKSSPEENNSILIKTNLEPTIANINEMPFDDESDARESILFVNDQHKANCMFDAHRSIDDDSQLFASKDQAKKIINDVFNMSSIRTLNAIKSDKQIDDLLRTSKQTENSAHCSTTSSIADRKLSNTSLPSNISNFKISSTKKQIPPVRMSSLTTDHSSSTSDATYRDKIVTKDHLFSTNSSDLTDTNDQSLNKENEMKLKVNQYTTNRQPTEHDDEISVLKNRVSKLKKEFSLRQKEIENQNQQNMVNKYRKLSNSQTASSKNSILSSKDKQINRSSVKDALSNKQSEQQKTGNPSSDFESWTFKQE